MSQLITAAKKSIRRKSPNEYEDLDRGTTDAGFCREDAFRENADMHCNFGQELEMNSVSVVPDGMCNTYCLVLI